MPVVYTGPDTTPYLVYNAPVDEKTMKLREQFKVDPETGYPEHYNWRGMARLGPRYSFEDPFNKFAIEDPKERYSQKVALVASSIGLVGLTHYFISYLYRRPLWSKSYLLVANSVLIAGMALWLDEKSIQRQAHKNAIVIDYCRKHPERFGLVERPKVREVLFEYIPIR